MKMGAQHISCDCWEMIIENQSSVWDKHEIKDKFICFRLIDR
jgi:hypothetical protein